MVVTPMTADTRTLPLILHIAAKFTLEYLFGAVPAGEQSPNQPLHPPPDAAMPCK